VEGCFWRRLAGRAGAVARGARAAWGAQRRGFAGAGLSVLSFPAGGSAAVLCLPSGFGGTGDVPALTDADVSRRSVILLSRGSCAASLGGTGESFVADDFRRCLVFSAEPFLQKQGRAGGCTFCFFYRGSVRRSCVYSSSYVETENLFQLAAFKTIF